ncbi:hypothetical protein F4781DRAFT_429271 [Annulohypoxylon bovei var. microspora]|nr:hypothetical protein F4781DRAFT_429271 [Annulohypoxylon bovei var. microspora]
MPCRKGYDLSNLSKENRPRARGPIQPQPQEGPAISSNNNTSPLSTFSQPFLSDSSIPSSSPDSIINTYGDRGTSSNDNTTVINNSDDGSIQYSTPEQHHISKINSQQPLRLSPGYTKTSGEYALYNQHTGRGWRQSNQGAHTTSGSRVTHLTGVAEAGSTNLIFSGHVDNSQRVDFSTHSANSANITINNTTYNATNNTTNSITNPSTNPTNSHHCRIDGINPGNLTNLIQYGNVHGTLDNSIDNNLNVSVSSTDGVITPSLSHHNLLSITSTPHLHDTARPNSASAVNHGVNVETTIGLNADSLVNSLNVADTLGPNSPVADYKNEGLSNSTDGVANSITQLDINPNLNINPIFTVAMNSSIQASLTFNNGVANHMSIHHNARRGPFHDGQARRVSQLARQVTKRRSIRISPTTAGGFLAPPSFHRRRRSRQLPIHLAPDNVSPSAILAWNKDIVDPYPGSPLLQSTPQITITAPSDDEDETGSVTGD